MKRIFLFVLLVTTTLLQPLFAITVAPSLPPPEPQPKTAAPVITLKDWEKATGKRLNFLQRLQWKLAQKPIRKLAANGTATEKQKKLGKLSLIFGVTGLVMLFIPYIGLLGIGLGIAAFILGLKSVKGNSNTPGLIGLIAGSLTLLLTLIAVIALAAFLSGGWI